MTARIDEIAPDLYRICVYVPAFDLQFNHFLVRDDEPLLFHTGMRGMFLIVEAVTQGPYLFAALLVFAASCFFHSFALWTKHRNKRRNDI